MVTPIKEETFSKVIDWIQIIALIISIFLLYQYLYALLGLTVLFLVFLVLVRLRRYSVREIPSQEITLYDTTVAQVEDDVARFRRAVGEYFVALDHSKRVRSQTEHAWQVGFSLYFFLSLYAYARTVFATLSSYQAGAFLAWAGLVILGLFLGDLYTSYVKTYSSILAARKIRNLAKALANQSKALETRLMELASRVNDSGLLRNRIAHRLKAATEQLLGLESEAKTRASGLSLKELVELVIALAALLPSVFASLGQIEITVFAILLLTIAILFGVLGALVCLVVPYGRAYSLLRGMGIDEMAERTQRGLSTLQAMALSEENLSLVQSSFLFTRAPSVVYDNASSGSSTDDT